MVNFVSKHNRNIVSCTKLQDPEECECVKVVGMRESNGQNHREDPNNKTNLTL